MTKCLYENVLISASFEYVDTDSVMLSSSLHEELNSKFKTLFNVNDEDLEVLHEIFHSGETHAIPAITQKER